MHQRNLHLSAADVERANLHIAHGFALTELNISLNLFQRHQLGLAHVAGWLDGTLGRNVAGKKNHR